MYVQAVGQVVHVLGCHLFFCKLGMGITGIGYAGVVTNGFIYVSLLVYTATIDEFKSANRRPGLESFSGLKSFLRLGLPSMLNHCLEWWAYEILCFLCGYIGVHEQAAFMLIFNIICVLYCVSFGLGMGLNSLVG